MIIRILDEKLPIELTDKIYRNIHRSIMREISIIIKYKIVFVYYENHLSFLVCENQNYYCALDVF